MEIFQLAEADRNASAGRIANRHVQLGSQLRHHLVEIIAVQPQRPAAGELRRRLGHTTAAAAAEVAQHQNAEWLVRLGRCRCRLRAGREAEFDLS